MEIGTTKENKRVILRVVDIAFSDGARTGEDGACQIDSQAPFLHLPKSCLNFGSRKKGQQRRGKQLMLVQL